MEIMGVPILLFDLIFGNNATLQYMVLKKKTRPSTIRLFCKKYVDGLTRVCSNFIANTMGLQQSCTKPWICLRSIDFFQSIQTRPGADVGCVDRR